MDEQTNELFNRKKHTANCNKLRPLQETPFSPAIDPKKVAECILVLMGAEHVETGGVHSANGAMVNRRPMGMGGRPRYPSVSQRVQKK